MSQTRKQQRVVAIPHVPLTWIYYAGAGIGNTQVTSTLSQTDQVSSREYMSDGSNFRGRSSKLDNGGPFTHTKWESVRSGGGVTRGNCPPYKRWTFSDNYHTVSFTGSGGISDVLPSIPLPPSFTQSQLDAYGTTGWARCKPTKPDSQAARFIGELSNIPRLPGIPLRRHPQWYRNKINWFRSLGGNYLNVVFGWIPFVTDLLDMIRTCSRLRPLLNQIMRDNGKPIRRQIEVFRDTVTAIRHDANGINGVAGSTTYVRPTLPTAMYDFTAGRQYRTITTTIKTRVWFSARFRYFLSENRFLRNLQVSQRLFGFGIPTPKLLWDLTPWSWLFSWFSNAGDVIDNLGDPLNGLTADYAYVMAETRETIQATAFAPLSDGGLMESRTRITKLSQQRSKATPYGFGLNWTGFSASQLAILVSLGWTKLKP